MHILEGKSHDILLDYITGLGRKCMAEADRKLDGVKTLDEWKHVIKSADVYYEYYKNGLIYMFIFITIVNFGLYIFKISHRRAPKLPEELT